MLGALLIALIRNGSVLLDIDTFYQQVIIEVIINIDSGTTPQPDNVPLFATDNIAAARKAADLLADALGPGDHRVAFIPFQPGTMTNDRTTGFTEGLAKHLNLTLVAKQSSNSDPNTALSVTENIVTANPDLDGIFAATEPGVVGAINALNQAGKTGKIKIIGWDAPPDEIKGITSGAITALIVQNPFRMGFDPLIAMVKTVRTGQVAPSENMRKHAPVRYLGCGIMGSLTTQLHTIGLEHDVSTGRRSRSFL